MRRKGWSHISRMCFSFITCSTWGRCGEIRGDTGEIRARYGRDAGEIKQIQGRYRGDRLHLLEGDDLPLAHALERVRRVGRLVQHELDPAQVRK